MLCLKVARMRCAGDAMRRVEMLRECAIVCAGQSRRRVLHTNDVSRITEAWKCDSDVAAETRCAMTNDDIPIVCMVALCRGLR